MGRREKARERQRHCTVQDFLLRKATGVDAVVSRQHGKTTKMEGGGERGAGNTSIHTVPKQRVGDSKLSPGPICDNRCLVVLGYRMGIVWYCASRYNTR